MKIYETDILGRNAFRRLREISSQQSLVGENMPLRINKVVVACALLLASFAAFTPTAQADIINLICQLEYGNTGTLAPRNYWIDTQNMTVSMGGWIGIQGEDPNDVFTMPGLRISSSDYSWDFQGWHSTINRMSGLMSTSMPPHSYQYSCRLGNNPMPAPKF